MTGTTNDAELDGLVEALSQPTDNSNGQRSEPELPEKYRGKSVEEIVDMHRNAERELGRLGSQLGEQRELVNVLASKIDAKRRSDLGNEGNEPEPVKLTPEALLDNPEETLERWLQSKQKRAGASSQDEDRIAALEQQISGQALAAKHPDYVEVSNSQEFIDWVKESPLRLMTAQAGAQGDVNAAIAVLDEYKNSSQKGSGSGRDSSAASAAQLERGSANAPEPGQSSGKKYSRRAIRALMERNPQKYEQLKPQIRAAYERGDVINDLPTE